MKKELQVFLTAVMFYTRIPCPRWVDHSQDLLEKATRYFPLIGWIGSAGINFGGIEYGG
jgi:adenosylcobinamide-GDP ribazoletransferase